MAVCIINAEIAKTDVNKLCGPPNFFELSYYTGSLQGENRFLKHLSRFIKTSKEDSARTGNLAELFAVYEKCRMESELKRSDNFPPNWLDSILNEDRSLPRLRLG